MTHPISSLYSLTYTKAIQPVGDQRALQPQAPQPQESKEINLEAAFEIFTRQQPLPQDREFLEQLNQLFKQYVDKETLLGATPIEIAAKRRIYRESKQALRELCQAKSLPLALREDEPVVVLHLEMFSRESIEKILCEKQKVVILQARPLEALASCPKEQIPTLYTQCANELKLVKKLSARLQDHLDNAKIPEAAQRYLQFEVIHSKQERLPAMISVKDIPMGFSIFELLFSLGIVEGEYQANHEFLIDGSGLSRLIEHLDLLKLWYDDFGMVFGELLAQDPAQAQQYYNVAYKPMAEIIKNPLRLGPKAKPRLRAYEDGCVVLFNQIGIDLRGHPHKDLFKSMIEGFYRLENMIGANGQPKEFMHSAPYQSVLNTHQLQQICPHLNKQLALQRVCFEFFGVNTWEEALPLLPLFGLQSELDLFKQNKTGRVLSMLKDTVASDRTRDFLTQQDMRAIGVAIEGCTCVAEIEQTCKQQCQSILERRTGVALLSRAPSYAITLAHKQALYRGQPMMLQLTPTDSLKNVFTLFSALESSQLLQTVLSHTPDFRESIAFLKEEFRRRYHQYPSLYEDGFYGKRVFREAVDFFEDFVAKIVYAREIGLKENNIQDAMQALVGICNSDLRNCAEGFAGRIQTLLLALMTQDAEESLETTLTGILLNTAKEKFHELAGPQSSHDVKHLRLALKFLGDNSEVPDMRFEELSDYAKEIVRRALLEITPFSLYEASYQWVSNTFWELNKECEHEKIYALLAELGFGEDRQQLDKLFKVYQSSENSWQYAFFQQALPQRLVGYLVTKGYVFIKDAPSDERLFQKRGSRAHTVADHPYYGPRLQAPAAAAAAAAPRAQLPDVARDRAIGFQTQSGLPGANVRSS